MAPSQKNDVNDAASYRKIAQLHAAIKNSFDIEYIERILQKDGNINYRITDANNLSYLSSDCSLLHLAYRFVNFEVFELLLSHGADFTVKDNEGNTVVHKIIQTQFSVPDRSFNEFEDKFTDSVLSAHVKFKNYSNPRCKHGISHFHVACMRNNAEAVEFFLKNGVDVNQAVTVDSPIFAGYTPLHFAVEFFCLQILEILLNYGANLRLKNAAMVSPLELLIDRKIRRKVWEKKDAEEKMLELLAKHDINVNDNADDFGLTSLHVSCTIEDTSAAKSILEKITDISIINRPVPMNSPICPGYTPLHFAAISTADTVKLLLDKGADIEAKNANGEIPFEFCVQRFSVEDIHDIISSQTRWSNITLSDNKTRLLDVVSAMMDVDKLINFLGNLESIIDLTVPEDSPLWPGYTILHLAVVFSEKTRDKPNYFGYTSDTKKVEECLIRGAEITKADVNNSTALHLAFYLQKFRTVEVLLKHHLTFENPFDNNNLSHFHIACAARHESAVERFLSNGVDVNVPIAATIEWYVLVRSHLDCKPRYLFLTPGTTALHINVACGNIDITRMLIEHGADVYAKDVHGFTPIHRALTSNITSLGEGIDNFLFGTDDLQDRTTEDGLSHLHVACHLDLYSAVERLLDSGADVNAVVTYDKIEKILDRDDYFLDPYGNPEAPLSFLSHYKGFTPLHSAIHGYCVRIVELLLRRGADILIGNFGDYAPIRKIFSDEHRYDEIVLSVLANNSALKIQLKDRFGLTMLHIACYVNNVGLVVHLLLEGGDANAQIHGECPIWPGNTPLHVAAKNISSVADEPSFVRIFRLLLENGADVTLKNKDGDTPLHLISGLPDGPLAYFECAQLMLKSLKNFDIDTAHSQKISFFHFACLLKNVAVVEGYLENGINVNRSVDFFSDQYPGCSPLHLAATCGGYDLASQSQIVDLLLKHGANVCVKDAFENTVLHSTASLGSSCRKLFDRFIRDGVDVNAENILGETALELLIKSGLAHWVDVECLLKNGSHINSFNSISQVGYIAKVFEDRSDDEDFEKKVFRKDLQSHIIRNLISSEYVSEVDDEGRTIIHNLVAISRANVSDYVGLIRKLVEHGCDINRRDKEGRTALHTATWFRNNKGALGLMKNGADVNITDKQGKTAFTYSFEPPYDRHLFDNHSDSNHIINTFAMHVHKMELCGLYISEVNQRLQIDALEMYYLNEEVLRQFDANIKKSKSLNIGSTSLTLYDFGFEINAEMVYPSMPLSGRLEVDQFFENIRQHDLHELDYLLKLKYESAVERLRLINLAVNPFITLIKNQLPDLCCRVILGYLSSNDLKNVIALEDL